MTAADRPSVTPRIGDTITNAEQLDALPVGTVMRARNDLLAETGRLGADGMRVVWCEGWSEHADAIEHHAPLTVLYVPGEPSRPSVTDDARADLTDALAKYEAEIKRAQDSGQGPTIAILAGASLAHAVRDALADGRAETTEQRCGEVGPHGWKCVRNPGHEGQHGYGGVFWDGRAETTTEDEACGDYPAPCNCDDPETHDGALRTETTTATTEDALADLAHLILDTLHFEPSTRDAEMDDVMDVLRRHLLATARTRPTRTIYSVQHWEDADGIRASWVTGYGQYTHSREDAEATLRHQERQHPDTTFRLAQAEVTAWTEADQ